MASPLAVARPMRNPVKEPGPKPQTIASRSAQAKPAAPKTSSIAPRRFSLCVVTSRSHSLSTLRPAQTATVARVVNFGMFVEVRDLQLQGLVHVSALSDRFVRFDGRAQTLRTGRKTFRTGQRVSVLVSNVDFDNRRVDFVLA